MLWAMLVANLANFLLDMLLVFGAGPVPALGVAGAALSTTLCSWLQFALLAWALGPSVPGVLRRFEANAVKAAAMLGLPIGLHLIAESGIFSLVGLFAGRLGEASIAAHQIALAWASFTFSVAVGIGSAGTVRVGWSIGRGDTPAARRSGFIAFASGTAFMACAAMLFVLFPTQLAQVMSTQPEVIAVAASLFWVTAVFQISDGAQAIGAGVLRGAGDTRFVFWVNIIGHWGLGLPIAYWLGVKGPFGVVGLWWGLSAGLTAVGVCLLARFAVLSRREIAPLSYLNKT
jgi:MATE family multidrug resistance protein